MFLGATTVIRLEGPLRHGHHSLIGFVALERMQFGLTLQHMMSGEYLPLSTAQWSTNLAAKVRAYVAEQTSKEY